MKTGNIVKLKDGSVVIIVEVKDNDIRWISSEYSNSSGGTPILTTENLIDCDCLIDKCGHIDTEWIRR